MNELGGEPNDIDEISDRIFAEYKLYTAIAGRDLIEGAQFSTGNVFSDVGAGNTADFLLRNPGGADVYLFPSTRASTSAEFYFNKELNPTVNATGSAVDVVQRRADSSNTTPAEAYSNPDVTEDGDAFNAKVVGSGGSGGQSVGAIFGGPEVVLAPGDDLYVKAVNQAGTAEDVAIDVDFTEVSADLIADLDSFPG